MSYVLGQTAEEVRALKAGTAQLTQAQIDAMVVAQASRPPEVKVSVPKPDWAAISAGTAVHEAALKMAASQQMIDSSGVVQPPVNQGPPVVDTPAGLPWWAIPAGLLVLWKVVGK